MVKTINLNSYTGNLFTFNSNITWTNKIGSMTITQTGYDSENEVYVGTVNINLRLQTSNAITSGTTLFTFNSTYWKPWHGTVFPAITSANAASGTLSWSNIGTNVNGNVQVLNGLTGTSAKYIHVNITHEIALNKDLRTW